MGNRSLPSPRLLRTVLASLSALALFLGLAGTVLSRGDHAVYIEIDDAINPITAGFLERALGWAEEDGAELIIIRLDTPGGLLSSTRDMVTALLESPVPSVVYVAPGGAHAASAGTFITAAANFAVMAPATNIGAASPVGAAGEDLPETMKSKVTEDAAALMRDIATTRGRDVASLESTVLKARAFSSEEAVELGMVDFIAKDLGELLEMLDGLTADTPVGPRTLSTDGLAVRDLSMSLVERLLLFLSEPNISFLLLSLGGLGIVIELFSPGLIVPGVVGAICLLLAFVVLGNLPVNWAGVVFILLAMALLFFEVQVAGFGILGVGAMVSFLLGGLLLFHQFGAASPTMTTTGVSLWVLGTTTAVLAGVGAWVVYMMVESTKYVVRSTADSVVGRMGTVTMGLNPKGTVQIGSELWTAVSDGDEPIEAGERVEVMALEDLTVRVSKATEQRS